MSTKLGYTRNLARARKLFVLAFADSWFSDDEELFEARWRDEMRELLDKAKRERHLRINYWERIERKQQSDHCYTEDSGEYS